MRKCRNYNKRVTFQQLDATPDAHGHVDDTDTSNWTHYAAGYAVVETKGGREFWKVDQVAEDVSHVWWMPWSKTIAAANAKMQLVHDELVYEILSVIDLDMAHKEVEIQTRRALL